MINFKNSITVLAIALCVGILQAKNITIKNTSKNSDNMYLSLYPEASREIRAAVPYNKSKSISIGDNPIVWLQVVGDGKAYSKGLDTNKSVESIEFGNRTIKVTYTDGTVA